MRILLILIFLLMTTICQADVTAKIIGVVKDGNGNIEIRTQYKVDGVEVVSRYPQMNGMYYWVSRYDVKNFAGMTKAQILSRIKKDIQAFESHLITRKFLEINNDSFVTNGQTLIDATDTMESTSIYLDTDNDGILDKEWVLKTDGSKIENNYTPVP